MKISGHEFDGVYTDLDNVPEYDIGVYVVVCLVDGRPHCVLYIGTSEGGQGRRSSPDVAEESNLQGTLQSHAKRREWQEAVHGEVGYFVHPELESDRRISLRDELQWKYTTPVGTDPWDSPGNADEAPFREEFDPRGSESI